MKKSLRERVFHKEELKALRILNKKLSNQLRLKSLALKACEKILYKKILKEKGYNGGE